MFSLSSARSYVRRIGAVTAVAVAALSVSGAATAVAQPVAPGASANSCQITSGAGNIWTFPEGTVVTVIYPDGSKHQRKCEAGTWQNVPSIAKPRGPAAVVALGSLGVALVP